MNTNTVLLDRQQVAARFGLARLGSHHIHTEITIHASPERVWQVIADTAHYPEWNPVIVRLEGVLKPGETIEFENQDLKGRRMVIRPTVLRAEEGTELRWLGHLWIPRLFDGEHYFTLTPTPEGHTLLQHGENFRGALVPFMRGWLNGEIKDGFTLINAALKTRAERAAEPTC